MGHLSHLKGTFIPAKWDIYPSQKKEKKMTSREISEERKALVVQSNELIRNSKISLTAQQYKALYYIISKVEKDDDDFKEYVFDLKLFCKVLNIGAHGNELKYLLDSILELTKKATYLKEGNVYTTCHLVSKARINLDNSTITIRLDEDLKPYLLHLKSNFTMLPLEDIVSFKSKYSIYLHNLFCSYLFLNELEIELDDLKEKLEATNYTTYKDFRVRVLEPAVEEINNYSSKVWVEYEAVKEGRAVKYIRFTIEETDFKEANKKLRKKRIK